MPQAIAARSRGAPRAPRGRATSGARALPGAHEVGGTAGPVGRAVGVFRHGGVFGGLLGSASARWCGASTVCGMVSLDRLPPRPPHWLRPPPSGPRRLTAGQIALRSLLLGVVVLVGA